MRNSTILRPRSMAAFDLRPVRPGDARWLVVTVEQAADARPADTHDCDPSELVRAWASERHGSPVALTRLLHACCWRLDGPAHARSGPPPPADAAHPR